MTQKECITFSDALAAFLILEPWQNRRKVQELGKGERSVTNRMPRKKR